MKHRFVVIVVSALTALAAGGVTAYWFLNRSPGGGDLPAGVRAVPQDALMTLSLTTDKNQWARLRQLGTEESQTQLSAVLNRWGDRLLTANGLDYTEDIQPWIGDEITIAIMGPTELTVPTMPDQPEGSPSAGGSNGNSSESSNEAGSGAEIVPPEDESDTPAPEVPLDFDPNLIDPTQDQAAVVFLPIADPLEAQERLTRAVESGTPPTEREYRGVTIQTFEEPGEPPYEAAVLDRRLLAIATQTDILDSIIDTYKGDPSIPDTPGYEDAVRSVMTPQPFAQVFVNAKAARAIAAANATDDARPRNLAPLQNSQGFAATATVNSDGIRFQGTSWLLPDSPPLQLENSGRSRLASYLPDSSLIVMSGSNLKTLWDGYSQRTADVAEGPFAPKNLRTGTQTLLGLDLEADVMAWMSGSFALALASAEDETSNVPSAGLVFLIEASNPTLAKQTLTQLDDTVESRYRFRVTDTQLGGQEVVNWQSPFAAITLTRGWFDDDVVFLGFNNVTKNMVPEPASALANVDLFQRAIAAQPSANTGYFFINMEKFLQARDQLPVPNFPEEQAVFINAIRAMGVTTSVEGDRQLRYDVSIITHTTDVTPQAQ